MNAAGNGGVEREYIRKHHRHEPAENQCSSFLIKHIRAPVNLVRYLLPLCCFYFSACILFLFGFCVYRCLSLWIDPLLTNFQQCLVLIREFSDDLLISFLVSSNFRVLSRFCIMYFWLRTCDASSFQ